MPEKAPLFIKNFVDENAEFFRKDRVINDWLEIMESNVKYEESEEEGDLSPAKQKPKEEKKQAPVEEGSK